MTFPDDYRPWAREVSEGDILTERQAFCMCDARLRDFGLELHHRRDGKFCVVAVKEKRRDLNSPWEYQLSGL